MVVGSEVHEVEDHASLRFASLAHGSRITHSRTRWPIRAFASEASISPSGIISPVGAQRSRSRRGGTSWTPSAFLPLSISFLVPVYSSSFPRVEDFSRVTFTIVPTKFFRSQPLGAGQ